MSPDADDRPAPLLRVVRGDPSPEELAALVAVLSTRAGQGESPAARPVSRWAAPVERLRGGLRPGPGGWSASGLPR